MKHSLLRAGIEGCSVDPDNDARQIETLTGADLNDAQRGLNIAVALMTWRLSPHHTATRKS